MRINACKLIFIFIISQFIPNLFHYIITSLMPSSLLISVLLWVGHSSCFGGNFLHAILRIAKIASEFSSSSSSSISSNYFLKSSLSSRITLVTMSKTFFICRCLPSTVSDTVIGTEVCVANFILPIALQLLQIGDLF